MARKLLFSTPNDDVTIHPQMREQKMKKIIALGLFCLFSMHPTVGQTIHLQGTRTTLPVGNVVGAALSDDLIFVQQSVFHADGPAVRSARRILSWSLKTNSAEKERMLEADASPLVGDECGRVEVNIKARRIYVCENHESMAILNADDLTTISTIRCGGRIYDFAVDYLLQRIFVVWRSNSDVQYLTAFDMASGKELEQTKISSGSPNNAQLIVDARTKRVALAEAGYQRSGITTYLYGCSYTGSMTCEYIEKLPQVSQIAMWGPEVLLASGLFGDDPHVCLTSVNLTTHATAHQYCSSRKGVHYGVGILDGKYVVGYSGVVKRLHWKETTLDVSSSVSVWTYENGTVAAEALQEGDESAFQGAARIACNRAAPEFLLYSVTSNIAYIYSIHDVVSDSSR
jgi:hypothetical protein